MLPVGMLRVVNTNLGVVASASFFVAAVGFRNAVRSVTRDVVFREAPSNAGGFAPERSANADTSAPEPASWVQAKFSPLCVGRRRQTSVSIQVFDESRIGRK